MATLISKEDKEQVIKGLAFSYAENYIKNKSHENNDTLENSDIVYEAYKLYINAYSKAIKHLEKEENDISFEFNETTSFHR